MATNPNTGLKQAIICYVTDRKALSTIDPVESLVETVRIAAAAGVDWVQLREKDLPARELLRLTQNAIRATSATRTCIILNDRLDIALAAGAGGVHLGAHSVPADEAVRWCRAGNAPAEFVIGVSCHSIEEAQNAERSGANYIFFGPVFETPSKKIFGAPQGTESLAEMCRSVRIPVIAIGGINETNGEQCRRAGAAGIAAIRLFQDCRDRELLGEIVSRLHRGDRPHYS